LDCTKLTKQQPIKNNRIRKSLCSDFVEGGKSIKRGRMKDYDDDDDGIDDNDDNDNRNFKIQYYTAALSCIVYYNFMFSLLVIFVELHQYIKYIRTATHSIKE
jgi:hypothetical protein